MSSPVRAPQDDSGEGIKITDKRRLDPVTGLLRTPADAAGAGEIEVEVTATGSGESVIDPVQLELVERTEDLQRLQAEYANYRRRVERDRDLSREQAIASTLAELLPVLDDIGRARTHGELEGGFRSVGEALESGVSRLGLKAYGAAGDPFDPAIHEAYVKKLIQGGADQVPAVGGGAPVYKLTNDPRITPFGRFLRRSSLDEFPQFFNVLRGDMSTVGPRPHMIKHNEEYSKLIANFMGRHYIKPGITGLAQSMGYRGETKNIIDMQSRVKLDRFYIENWSFFLDIKIIAMTVLSLLRGSEKAY